MVSLSVFTHRQNLFRKHTPDSEKSSSVPHTNLSRPPLSSLAGSEFSRSRVATTTARQFYPRPFFRSRRVRKESIERPWLDDKDSLEKWAWIIPCIGLVLGLGICGLLIYRAMAAVPKHDYCLILSDDFSSGSLNPSIWTKEVQVGGFGNGQFEETTADDENAFIRDGQLWIKPTLQNASLVENNNVLNLIGNGCTGTTWTDCVAVTNTTNGTIINPVKSARINTKAGASIKYGRIEVEARLPAGDWLWPGIWLLPISSVYGEWPASGEIDVMESRGNNYTYPYGDNYVSSTLHWGPDSSDDEYWKTSSSSRAPPFERTWANGFHTYGLEWSEKYLFTYINTRLLQVLYVKFNEPFWVRGDFSGLGVNDTELVDPWGQTGSDSTPFDEDFYLILDVAVGGTNGWFTDNVASKPWVDASTQAKKEFWDAKDQWYPTWEDNGQMIVKSVNMWQQKGYNGC